MKYIVTYTRGRLRSKSFTRLSRAKEFAKHDIDPLRRAYIYKEDKNGKRILLYVWRTNPKNWHYGIFEKQKKKN